MNRYDQIIRSFGGRCFGSNRGELPTHLSEEELTDLEHELGSQLPSDYREFMRDYSGYALSRLTYFPLKSTEGQRGGISLFFGAGDDLLSQYRDACDSDWPIEQTIGLTLIRPLEELEVVPYEQEKMLWVLWPTELLPIGDSGGGDMTCLIITGKQTGHVYFWLHDPGTRNPSIYHVANSFDEFMQLLRVEDE